MSLTLPNLLSALRVGLIPLFIISVIHGEASRALAIFTIAAVTDLLDGLIARLYDQKSVLGAYLDPMADKLLLTAAYVMLAIPDLHPGQQIPVWVTVLVITRDVIIVTVAGIVYLKFGISEFVPSRVSKWNTAFQLIAIFAVLVSGVLPTLEELALVLLYAVAGLTIASGLEYAYRFIYRADRLPEMARAAALVHKVPADAPGTRDPRSEEPS